MSQVVPSPLPIFVIFLEGWLRDGLSCVACDHVWRGGGHHGGGHETSVVVATIVATHLTLITFTVGAQTGPETLSI